MGSCRRRAGPPDEDPRGGSQHGGWAQRLQRPGHGQGGRGGHGQYRCHAAWATDVRGLLRLLAQADQQPFTEVLNDTQKYVASTTLTEPLPWSNSTLLGGDAAEAVARLKQQPGKDLTVLGSS